ncbi:MAG: ABC transporter permease [Acidobacteria bacterium]|nr:ABC transporter permease [Acidobacteriota bacterium]
MTLDSAPANSSLRSSFWLAAGTLWWRELLRFYRHRSRVVGALGTPLVFWLLIGSGIGTSFHPGGAGAEMNYLEYFFPGTLVLIVLFTSIFCMMSIIEDRHEGFLLSVLVAPVTRSSLVLGKLLGGATLAVLQGLVFVLLAPAVGIPLGPAPLILLTGVLFLIAFALTGLGFLFAWQLDSVQGFHAIANLFLIPLWLLSGALFPASGASTWVRWVMALNPLTYALAAVRRVFYWGLPEVVREEPSLGLAVGVTLVFAALTTLAAFVVAERPLSTDLG